MPSQSPVDLGVAVEGDAGELADQLIQILKEKTAVLA